MEEQIKRAVRNLNISYIFFWVLPAFLLGAGEFELLPVGSLADNAQAVYYFETLGILLTALCIPLSLKLFSLVLKKKIDQMTITLALKCYVQWSIVRLGILEVAIVTNLLCYYLTLSTTGNLCMLIGLTASLFCLPGEIRLIDYTVPVKSVRFTILRPRVTSSAYSSSSPTDMPRAITLSLTPSLSNLR